MTSIEAPAPIALDAFTSDVTNRVGIIDARVLASVLELPLTTVAPALGVSARWLADHLTAEEVQPKAKLLLGLANDLAANFGDRNMVRSYFKTKQPDFKGRTPAEELKKGHLTFLCGYVSEIVTMRPD